MRASERGGGARLHWEKGVFWMLSWGEVNLLGTDGGKGGDCLGEGVGGYGGVGEYDMMVE